MSRSSNNESLPASFVAAALNRGNALSSLLFPDSNLPAPSFLRNRQLLTDAASPSNQDLLAALSLRRASLTSFGFPSGVVQATRSGAQTQDLRLLSEPSTTVRHEAMVNEAYKRGREEAILALLSCGAITPSSLGRVAAVAAAAAPDEPETPEDSKPSANTLQALGSEGPKRRKQNAPYFDASELADPDEAQLANRRTRGGVTEPFPEKLHRMLKEAEDSGKSDVISFFPHGRAFAIHHPERFCREIMPKYFKQSRLSSFQRQLNLYGFQRIQHGPDAGGYFHELFLKGRPALAIHMRRVGVPQGAKSREKRNSNAVNCPDFYSMPVVKKAKSTDEEEEEEEK